VGNLAVLPKYERGTYAVHRSSVDGIDRGVVTNLVPLVSVFGVPFSINERVS